MGVKLLGILSASAARLGHKPIVVAVLTSAISLIVIVPIPVVVILIVLIVLVVLIVIALITRTLTELNMPFAHIGIRAEKNRNLHAQVLTDRKPADRVGPAGGSIRTAGYDGGAAAPDLHLSDLGKSTDRARHGHMGFLMYHYGASFVYTSLAFLISIGWQTIHLLGFF